MDNLLDKENLSINDTTDKIREALLTLENIILVIDSVSTSSSTGFDQCSANLLATDLVLSNIY